MGFQRILSVVGARPNLMKMGAVARGLASAPDVEHIVVHTGQHYDDGMSGAFFRELELPPPTVNLAVGSGSHGRQTGEVMIALEPVLAEQAPDIVLVYGDVNSTLAAAVVASKLGLLIGHVEAGLRSGDRTMPEELNRRLTDQLADLLFIPSCDVLDHLRREGVPDERIFFVGNVMIDTLMHQLPRAQQLGVLPALGLTEGDYVVVTLHRPSNVDNPDRLRDLLHALRRIADEAPVIFPVHPRTRQRLEGLNAGWDLANLRFTDPISYQKMLALVAGAGMVITDSGGLQEETTHLGVPCLTVRPNTERPVTCTHGTNRLVEPCAPALLDAWRAIRGASRTPRAPIPGWDGRAGHRIAAVLSGSARWAGPDALVSDGNGNGEMAPPARAVPMREGALVG
jgi:UDP-N-acetylglucosamine 2-epimerase (non-hydrolysing)